MAMQLRDTVDDDIALFFVHQLEESAQHMAAFVSKDPSNKDVFMAHWAKIRANNDIITKTILYENNVIGYVSSYVQSDKREITYWIDKGYWGRGITTQALSTYLDVVTERPLFGRVAKDNFGSKRVLEKCGFKIIGEDKGFANARNAEIEEYILRLD